MLSVCITVKNRSRCLVDGHELQLFPRCVASLSAAVGTAVDCELVVSDWSSDDWPLHEWISAVAGPLPTQIVQVDGRFSRGRGLNVAAGVARGNALFFTDADVLFARDVFDLGLRRIHDGHAYFPVLYSFDDATHTSGWWRHEGYGNCFVSRGTFEAAGRWPEYDTWGREDDEFFAAVERCSAVEREQVPGFFHQWHPEDILWKDRYAGRPPEEIDEILRTRGAVERLGTELDADRDLVLIDDSRFGVDDVGGRRAYPFLETNGEYAGPPPDDETAIEALERLRAQGVGYLVVAWMSFWWLEHYTKFASHVRSSYPIVIDDATLKVFDLDRSRIRSEP